MTMNARFKHPMIGKYLSHSCPDAGEVEQYYSIVLDAHDGQYLVQLLYVTASPHRRRGEGGTMVIPMRVVSKVYDTPPTVTTFDCGGEYKLPVTLYAAFKGAESKEAFKQYIVPRQPVKCQEKPRKGSWGQVWDTFFNMRKR